MKPCLIALGANINASSDLFRAALDCLASTPDVFIDRISQPIVTSPVGANAGDEFLNAAATVRTKLSPHDLLARLHAVEKEFGRERTIHWGPRRLDLDLILYESTVVNDDRLVVPHPACWYRKFVLEPASEIAGEMIHPLLNESIEQLFQQLGRRPVRIQILAGSMEIDVGQLVCAVQRHVPATSVGWSSPETSPESHNNFATVRIDATTDRSVNRTQPGHQSGRQITIWPSHMDEAVDELLMLAKAILGK